MANSQRWLKRVLLPFWVVQTLLFLFILGIVVYAIVTTRTYEGGSLSNYPSEIV